MTRAWISWASVPSFLRFDRAGAHTSEQMRNFCAQSGTTPLVRPAGAHDRQSRVERRVDFFKNHFCWVAHQLPFTSRDDLWVWAVPIAAAQNAHMRNSGVSPNRYMFGPNPRLPQSRSTVEGRESAQAMPLLPEHQRAEQLRMPAQVAYFEMHDVSAVKRASRSKHRSADRLRPGDIIYFCRERQEASVGACSRRL